MSSPAISDQTGWPIGFWASELTHPLRVFQEAGFEITIASTDGGRVVMDSYSDPRDPSGYSAHDIITLGYLQLGWFEQMLSNTKSIAEVDHDGYDAVFLVGGQAPMYTFRQNQTLNNLFLRFFMSGKPSAAVCHATTMLLGVKLPNGKLLVEGKTWTGFANSEEDFADQAVGLKIQPYRIEEEAAKLKGTTFKVAAAFSSYAIADGNLITGQQQNSGEAVARLIVGMLK